MSELTSSRLANLKRHLERRRDELRIEIHEDTQSGNRNFADMTSRVRDPGDESLALQMSDYSISALEKQMAELRDVNSTLQRIEDGTYGECMDCGGEIPLARLEAYATAQRCTHCQSRREHTYRPASPSL